MFERLVGKIKKIKKLREYEKNGIKCVEAETTVFPICGIPGKKIPKDIKRKKVFKRIFIFPYEPSVNDEIVLTEEESLLFLKDHKEKSLIKENEFLKIETFKGLGARIGKLIYKPKNTNLFNLYGDIQAKGWVLKGGILDVVSFDNYLQLWDAAYKKVYGFLEYKKHGIILRKKIKIVKDLPLFILQLAVSVKKKRKVELGEYVMVNAFSTGYEHIIYYLSNQGIEYERYHKPLSPWYQTKSISCYKTGGVLYFNENKKISFMLLTEPQNLETVEWMPSHNGPEIAFLFKRVEIEKEKRYNLLIALGENFHLDKNSMTIISRYGEKTIFLTRSILPVKSGFFESKGRKHPVKFEELNIKGVGRIYKGLSQTYDKTASSCLKGLTYA